MNAPERSDRHNNPDCTVPELNEPSTESVVENEASTLTTEQTALIERHGYQLEGVYQSPRLGGIVLRLTHKETGFTLLSLQNTDPNNRFQLQLSTYADDSSGVFHIIEHCVLSGSTKLQVGEPFDEMRRSLILSDCGAYTDLDNTKYLIQSPHPESFKEAAEIILSSVLHPTLEDDILDRERGYLQLSEDQEGITYSGVVYNEMEGTLSDPNRFEYRALIQSLCPEHYAVHEFGGDPLEIPTLTNNTIRETYQKFYSPNRLSAIFTGDLDLESRLQILEPHLVGLSKNDEEISALPIVIDKADTRPTEVHYPFDAELLFPDGLEEISEEQIASTVQNHKTYHRTWSFDSISERQTGYEFTLLQKYLADQNYSPIHQLLMEEKLPVTMTSCYLQQHGASCIFDMAFRGASTVELEIQIQNVIEAALHTIATDGIDPQFIADSLEKGLWTEEISLNNSGFAKYCTDELSAWELGNGLGPDTLSLEERILHTRQRLRTEPVFQNLAKRYFIENHSQKDTVTIPSHELHQERSKQAAHNLPTIQEFSTLRIQEISLQATRMRILEEQRDTPKAIASVPTVPFDRSFVTIPEVASTANTLSNGSPLTYYPTTHKNALQLRLAFDASQLSTKEIPYANAVFSLLLAYGPQGYRFGQLGREIGSIVKETIHGIEMHSPEMLTKPRTSESRMIVHFGAQMRPGAAIRFISFMSNALGNPDFTHGDFFTVIMPNYLRNQATSLTSRHSLMRQVEARLEEQYFLNGKDSFMQSQVGMIQGAERLLHDWNENSAEFIQKLNRIHEKIFQPQNFEIAAFCHIEDWNHISERTTAALEQMLSVLPSDSSANAFPTLDQSSPIDQTRYFPTAVSKNYIQQRIDFFDAVHTGVVTQGELFIAVSLIDRILSREIRRKGGAYGAFGNYKYHSCSLLFSSNDDPHLTQTLKTFQSVASSLIGQVSDDLIHRSKTVLLGENVMTPDLFQPQAQAVQGRYAQVSTETTESAMREIFEANLEGVRKAMELIAQKTESEKKSIAVLAPRAAINEALKQGFTGTLVE